MSYITVSIIYHIWLCSIVTNKVLIEKQKEIEKLTREKGELQCIIYICCIYHNFIDTLLYNTASSQPVMQPAVKYVACLVYERKSNNKWLMHFIVAKHLNDLLEVSKTLLELCNIIEYMYSI